MAVFLQFQCLSGTVYCDRATSQAKLQYSMVIPSALEQDIIDGKLDKRKKGTYGPPFGKKSPAENVPLMCGVRG